MSEPKMGFFAKIYYSITSFKKYGQFLRSSTASAVLHVLVIALLCCVITYIPAVNSYNIIVDKMIEYIDKKAPDFKFANGKLEVYGDMPIILDGADATIIIDTSPGAEDILNSYDRVILITDDQIIQKNYVDRTYIGLEAFNGLEMTKETLMEVLPLLKTLGIPVFILLGLLSVGGKLVSIFIVSVIALIINSIKNTNLSYRSLFKISAYSLTFPLIIVTALGFLPVNFLLLRFLYYAIASVYVYGAISSIRKNLDTVANELFK